jgi:hypothetical protein
VTLSVYVAAASGEIERARRWTKALRDAGVEPTNKWIESIDSMRTDTTSDNLANPREPEYDAYRLNAAQQNVKDIRSASVFWYLVSETEPGRGGYFETGIAHANGSVLIFSGDTRQSVFCALGREYVDDMAAFCEVVRICHQEKL